MPYRFDQAYQGGWRQSRDLNQDANILYTSTDAMFNNLGKLELPFKSIDWPTNNPSELKNAICLARTAVASAGAGAATALAAHRNIPVEVEKYVGRVKAVRDNEVIAEIGPENDIDSWRVILPLDIFREKPQAEQAIRCTITRTGPRAEIDVTVWDNARHLELEDVGIDEEEWRHWASGIDV